MSEPSSSRDPLDELAEEFVARHRRGERPALTEFVGRHPDLAGEIRELFPALVTLERLKPVSGELSGTASSERGGTGPATLTRLGDYRIVREIGRGGMGIVYEAEQVSLGRHVALKVLPSNALLQDRHLQRFQREARAAGRLHHTNIVPVFGVGEDDGLHYFVMQFIPGQGLDQVLAELVRLRQDAPGAASPSEAASVAEALLTGPGCPTERGASGPLSGSSGSSAVLTGASGQSALSETGRSYWQGVARIGVQVAEALAYAHEQGVLHRDIKPSNLLLDTRGTVWVADFGLAKATDQDDVTRSGDFVGTLRYMAPERFRGQCDARSDLYALGLTLYELLTFRPAYDESDRSALLQRVMHEEPPRPRSLNRAVPRDLETVVLKAIARDPAHRYQTAAELAEDLRRFADDRQILARRATGAERAWRWCRKNRALASALAAIALSLVAGTVVSLVLALMAHDAADIAETNAKKADDERQAAIAARAEEAKAKANALELLAVADQARDDLQTNLYGVEMTLAGQSAESVWGLGVTHDFLEHWQPRPRSMDRRGWEWYYLHSIFQRPTRVYRHHDGVVWSVRFSPDGTRLASGGDDGAVVVVDARTGRRVAALRGMASEVRDVAWSRDGRRLAVACNGGLLLIWEVDSLAQPVPLRGHQRTLRAVAWSPDGKRLASAGEDRIICLWDTDTLQLSRRLPGHDGNVHALDWDAKGQRLASAGADRAIRVWDAATGKEVRKIAGLKNGALAVRWNPDGARLAYACMDPEVLIFDVTAGTNPVSLRGHDEWVWAVAWSPDGSRLVTGGMDNTVRLWEPTTGRGADCLRGHRGQVVSVCWSPDGKQLASAGMDRDVRVWHVEVPANSRGICEHSWRTVNAVWSPDGRRVASAAVDGSIAVWNPERDQRLQTWHFDRSSVGTQAWHPDGKRLARAGSDGVVHVWQTEDGRALHALSGHAGEVRALRWSPDGTLLGSAGADGTLRIWDSDGGRAPVVLRGHQGKVNDLAWHPSGRQLASAGWDRSVRLWDVKTGTETAVLAGHTEWVFGIDWSPDGKRIASGSYDRTIRLWDAETRQAIVLTGHSRGVTSVEWSPDGRRLVSASQDRTVKVWDPAGGRSLLTLVPPGDGPGFAHWSPDGACILSGGRDFDVHLWDARPGLVRERAAALLPVVDLRLKSDPSNVNDLLLRAEVLARHGEWDQSAFVWKKATHEAKSPPPFLQSGWWVAEAPADLALPAGAADFVRNPARPPAKDSALAWCPAPDAGPDGNLRAGAPSLFLTRVYSPNDQPVTVLCGGARPIGCWLDGVSLPTTNDTIPITLRAGWNTLLLRPAAGKTPFSCQLSAVPSDRLNALLDAHRGAEAEQLMKDRGEHDDARQLLRIVARSHRRHAEAQASQGNLAAAAVAATEARHSYEKLLALPNRQSSDVAELAEFLFVRAQGWTPLAPVEMVSSGGADLTRQPDGSILVTGKNPEQDTCTITTTTSLPTVKALRLDALPDARLPQGGSGRYPSNGNFLLSEFRLSVAGAKLEEAALGEPWCEYVRLDAPIANVLDGKADTAWNTWPRQAEPHAAIFPLRTPLTKADARRLVVRLEFHDKHFGKHGLGRFRLSVSNQPRALRAARWHAAFRGCAADTQLAAAYALHEDWQAVRTTLRAAEDQRKSASGLDAALLTLAHHKLGMSREAEEWHNLAAVRRAAWRGPAAQKAIMVEIGEEFTTTK